MLRALLASLSLAVLAAACTTEPQTSPGSLTRVHDQAFACDDTATDASWACTVDLTIAGSTVTTVGIHNDGSATGPRAAATLSDSAIAEIDALIATMPMSQESDELRCGGAPLAIRNYTIDFDTVGVRDLEFHSVETGPAHELENYVTGLLTAIDACTGTSQISFASCSPRIGPKQ